MTNPSVPKATGYTRPSIPFNPGETLLNVPRADGPTDLDIALFGIPFDGHTIGRDGARLGPSQIRQQSFNIRATNRATGVSPRLIARIGDIGDSPLDIFDPIHSFELITAFCKSVVDAGALPLAAGGDHGIALAMLRAVGRRHGPVAVVHFDAHPDTMDDILGNRYNHATPFRRATEEGLEDPTKHVMIGLRGTGSPGNEPYDWAAAQGMTVLDIDACFDLGSAGVVTKVREVIGNHPVYVSLDVDGLDPADMPGTGSPEPGGLRMRDMQRILRGLRGMRFVGGDINEVSPPLDPSGYTAFNAAHLLFEMLCLMSESRA